MEIVFSLGTFRLGHQAVGRDDFLAKSFTYQLYFNLVRPNSHKQNLSPWQIIEQVERRSTLQLCLLPPVFLDYYSTTPGGYDLPRLPYPMLPLQKRKTLFQAV
jgi:hypothetical protein